MAGIDSLDKHVQQISFRQCVTFCEHRQLKGWQPHVQLTVAKSSISTNESLVCSSHIAQLRAQSLHCKKSWTPQLNDQTLCFCARDCFFFELQWRDGHDAVASGRGWMLWTPKRNGRNRFLRETLGSPWNAYALCLDDALEIGKGWVQAAVKGA